MPRSEPGRVCPPGVFCEAGEGEPYGRTLLSPPDAEHELLAMRWRPGARCAPHDHGDSHGTIHLIEGRFVERRFRFVDGALECVSTATHDAPALLHIEANVIHDMVAPNGGLSIHRYATVIRGMRVWDVSTRRTLVVDDECGAWVPANDALVVSSQRWSEM